MKQLPAFPAMPYYPALTQDSIKAQFRFRDDSLENETGLSTSMVLSGGATIENGHVDTDKDTGAYDFACPYFGAADFTIEAKITFLSWSDSAGAYILGNYHSGGTVNDSWNLRVTQSIGSFRIVFSRDGAAVSSPSQAGKRDIQLGVEYHVVTERIGDQVSMYIDGDHYLTFTYAGALFDNGIYEVTSETRNGAGYGRCARRIRDIRIADRALYHGAIYNNFKDIQGGRTISRIVHNGKLLTGTATGVQQTETSVNIVTSNTFISIPHNPAFAVGTGDFRFEITFTYKGEASNWSGKTNPLLVWRTWAAPGQPSNLEIVWNPNGSGLYITTGAEIGDPGAIFTKDNPVVGQRYALVFERIDGIISLHSNGQLVNSLPYSRNINVNVTRPILIGTRYGGNNYSVYWTTLMEIEHCWFGIPDNKPQLG